VIDEGLVAFRFNGVADATDQLEELIELQRIPHQKFGFDFAHRG
jgi:hypothetical protein